MGHQTKLPPHAPQWSDTHPLGQNAALFAELSRRRRVDRMGWYVAAVLVAAVVWGAVL